MSAQDEILEKFIHELESQSTLTKSTIQKLKELWQQGKLNSKEEIFNAIEGGLDYVNENQGN